MIQVVRPAPVIDIGAAEGYYAVGLARSLPKARVIAYEMEADAAALLRQLAEINGMSGRIDLRGRCDREGLARDLGEPGVTLVICDVEGFEDVLLDPELGAGARSGACAVRDA